MVRNQNWKTASGHYVEFPGTVRGSRVIACFTVLNLPVAGKKRAQSSMVDIEIFLDSVNGKSVT